MKKKLSEAQKEEIKKAWLAMQARVLKKLKKRMAFDAKNPKLALEMEMEIKEELGDKKNMILKTAKYAKNGLITKNTEMQDGYKI